MTHCAGNLPAMTHLPAVTPCKMIRVDRHALHAFVDVQADLIERTPVPDDVFSPEDLFPPPRTRSACGASRAWRR